MIVRRFAFVVLAASLVFACSSTDPSHQATCDGDACGDAGSANTDAGGPGRDAGRLVDASNADARAAADAEIADASTDTTVVPDAGVDSGIADSGSDAAVEAAVCTNPNRPVLHPTLTAGVFCPFGPGRLPLTCAATQKCCEPPALSGAVSSCESAATACPTALSAAWYCEQTLDCGAGSVCCAGGTVAFDPVCSFDRGSGFTGSTCQSSCGTGQLQICASQAECPTGKICSPFKTKGLELGACR